MLFGFLQRFLQILLILSMVELVFEVGVVSIGHMPVVDLDGAGSNDDVHGFSKLGQISNCSCKGEKYRFNYVFVEFARGGNGNWIAVDHVKTFLVDGVLAFWLGYFLLSGVAKQQLLQLFVRNKASSDFVVVHALFSLV